MRITAIETLRIRRFSGVPSVRLPIDAGIVGLDETARGAGTVGACIHHALAACP